MAKKNSNWDSSKRPYGRHSGKPGSPQDWRAAFEEATMGRDEAEAVVGSDSPWAILGIKVGATIAEIKTAYRNWARKWHPDVCKEINAEEMFKKGQAAYSILVGTG